MFGIGLSEMVLITFILLIFVGPEKLPVFMRNAGRWYAQIRRMGDDLRRSFVEEADRMDADERYRQLMARRLQAEEERRKAMESAGEGTVAHGVPPTGSPPPQEVPPLNADDDPETPLRRPQRNLAVMATPADPSLDEPRPKEPS